MKKYVLFLSLLLAVVPTYAVPTCSSQWHTGNLAHVYEETDVWYEFRAVGFGNNPGECLSSPFTCEIYQCDVNVTSALPCKGDDTPISHCVKYLLEQCSEDGKWYMPIIRELEFISPGPCELTPAL